MVRPVSAQTRNEMRMAEQAQRLLQTAKNPVEKMRFTCLSRGATGILEFGKVFRRFDNDQSGSIKMDEFGQGIEECGMDLTPEQLDELFQQFDTDKSGAIDYNEFLRSIRPPLNSHRMSLIDLAFAKLDVNHDGQVTVEDLKRFYNVKSHPDYQNGVRSEDELLRDFLRKFEMHGSIDGVVTKDEFADYYSGISASIDDDMYFDLIMRQAWKL